MSLEGYKTAVKRRTNVYKSLNGLPKGKLCLRCDAFPLHSVLRDKIDSAMKTKVMLKLHEDTRHTILTMNDMDPEDCDFCRLIYESVQEHSPQRDNRCHMSAHVSLISTDGVLHLGVALQAASRWFFVANIGPLGNYRPDVHNLFTRPEKMRKVDWSVVRKWLHVCDSQHAGTCRALGTGDSRVPGFRVIDCKARTIISAPQNCHYAALSYVWGPSSDNATPHLHPSQLPTPVPLAIEDAIACTLAINLRYLWVDRYCIDQSDIQTKHDLIQCMDIIYRNSSVAIINAAGIGPDAGLPGVSTLPRLFRSLAMFRDLPIAAMPNIKEELVCSGWSTRGWTYQEGLLATRRLVFTQSQCYFQCPVTYTSEASQASFKVEDTTWDPDHVIDQTPGPTQQVFPSSLLVSRAISQRIDEYLNRILTYDSDILNAFMGVLRQAWHSESPTYHFWGLPFAPDACASVSLNEQFVNALLWSPRTHRSFQYLTRRREFPSWTWAGWRGLTGVAIAIQSVLKAHNDGSVYLTDSQGTPLRIEAYIAYMQASWNMYSFSPNIHVTGWFANVTLLESDSGGTFGAKVADRYSCVFATAHVPYRPSSGWRILFAERCPVILFFSPLSTATEVSCNGLLLRRTGSSTFERIGNFLHSITWSITRHGNESVQLRTNWMDADSPAIMNCVRRTILLA